MSSSSAASPWSAVFPCRFAFTYTDKELKAYSRLVALRQDPGPSGESYFATMLALIFGLGLMIVVARDQGLITPSALKPVAISTYGSFLLGAAVYALAIRLGYRRIERRYRAYAPEQSCTITFELDGIRCEDHRYDIGAIWKSVAEVRETAELIVLWVGFRDGFVVPTRLFADAAARNAFVTAARKRVAAAKSEQSKEEDANG